MNDFLSFKTMITPMIIRIIFLIGVALCVIAGIVWIVIGASSEFGGGAQVFGGIVFMLVGPLVCRIYCELLIVVFRILDELTTIRQRLAPPTGQGFPVMPLPPAQ
ncbi:MAG: DUF4282 domain-containing protein [Tepidisphaeraceae bacterium]|jgi:uncharacterized protein DUF4282